MELEERTVGSMGTSMTTEGALLSVREVGKESSPGCAAWSAEPEGFKRRLDCLGYSPVLPGVGAGEFADV